MAELARPGIDTGPLELEPRAKDQMQVQTLFSGVGPLGLLDLPALDLTLPVLEGLRPTTGSRLENRKSLSMLEYGPSVGHSVLLLLRETD